MFPTMERLINRRQQGDLGEASAIDWLTRQGATVLSPLGHSPDYDLAADVDGRLFRIQVKTSTQTHTTPDGHERCPVMIATNGGNQSWTGLVKRFDPSRFDFLFVLTGSGRRWLIPTHAIEAQNQVSLGGRKYAEFEIDLAPPIEDIVYRRHTALLESPAPGEYPSGQRTAPVKRLAYAFAGSNPASPIVSKTPVKPTRYERKLGQSCQAIINQKRRVTIPQKPFFDAGLENGGKVSVRADGPGRVVVEQVELPTWRDRRDALRLRT